MDSVTHYSTSTGTLTLKHAYPPPPQSCPVALIDVKMLLETMEATDTQVGEWVNVIGYVENDDKSLKRRKRGDASNVRVQAVMLWSAGSVRLADYEKAVLGRNKAESGKGIHE